MKNTKKALLTSVLCLVLCCSMLIGTTFAWFTDEVNSGSNIIQSGTLDAELWHADTNSEKDEDWKNAENGAIFDYKYWEPGYTQVKYIKVKNAGTLAFQYQMNIIPNELPVAGQPNLADVIDVYVFDQNATIDRAAVEAATPVGTLTDLITGGVAEGKLLPVNGSDDHAEDNAPVGEVVYAVVLKMQEDAGNEYQDLSVGGGFTVQLLATQYTWENDSFDHLYDDGLEFPPKATAINTGAQVVTATTSFPYGDDAMEYAVPFVLQFQPTESYEEAQASQYRYWHADYVVKADKDVPAGSVGLIGYYKAFCDDYNGGNWVAMTNEGTDIKANTEIRLVELLGATVNYEEICAFGNDGTGFLCTATDLTGVNAGTTITVELRLYETTADPTTTTGTKNEETGNHKVIGTYSYTFGDATLVGNAAQLSAALAEGGKVQLVEDIKLTDDTTFTIGSGMETVLDLNGHTLSGDNTRTATHNFMFDVNGGELTIKNGTVQMAHTGTNMGWSGAATVINVTAGGVLNVENAVIENLGGTDMNFAVHLNNWGEVTLNANNSVFKAPYCSVRVFNSGADMNNVKITNSTLTGNKMAFWVHNYDASDLGTWYYADGTKGAYNKELVDARLNLDIFGNNNCFDVANDGYPSAIRYGFNAGVYYDAEGNIVE